MKYVRPIFNQDYQRGFSIFTRTDESIISDGICWFESIEEASTFYPSHVYLAVDETRGIEAAENGVRWCYHSKYFDDPKTQVVCREPWGLNDYDADLAFLYALRLIEKDTPYDYTGLFGYALKIISGLDRWIKPLRKLPVPLHFPGSRFCSAAVADEYKHTVLYKEVHLLKEYHVTRISPVKLLIDFPYKSYRFDKRRI